MENKIILEMSREDIRELFLEIVNEAISKRNEIKLYSINQVAKKLNRANTTIKKLCESGVIHTTPDGKISQAALDDYLKNSSEQKENRPR